MNWLDWLILFTVAVWIAVVIIRQRRRSREGKGCCGECSCCASCGRKTKR